MRDLCVIDVPEGASLEDVLFSYGVEFPCGGYSLCGGCRVRVVEGDIPVTPDMESILDAEEIRDGWRLACQAQAHGRIALEIGQWESPILSDDAAVLFEPREGLGIAIDLGTTTLVAQLLDLRTGEILGVRTALNPQASHGSDVMSRVEYDLRNPGVLTRSIRDGLHVLVREVAEGAAVNEVLIAGNTVMHHLFSGNDVEPLSHVPFEPSQTGSRDFTAEDLGWSINRDCRVTFLPCIGGFVGSDILAGIVAVGVLESNALVALLDLGTNGEIVVGNKDGAICASTAAGPAFEAGRIRMGMRAAPGAISRVTAHNGSYACHVIGGAEARGICGSGLVDAVAASLDTGRVLATGRCANGTRDLQLCSTVSLTQADIRELQLAKGAIAAGLRILLERIHATHNDLLRVYLAGAFGNYVNTGSARRIGLLEVDAAKVDPSGNTALRGTKMLLGMPGQRDQVMRNVLARTEHISLASDPHFQDIFVDCMSFQ